MSHAEAHRHEATGGARLRTGVWSALAGAAHTTGTPRWRKGIAATLRSLLVLGGVLGSLLGAQAVGHTDADKQRLSFHLTSNEIASTLKEAIQHEEDLVISASAFFTSDPNATPAAFDRWAEAVHALQRYPELQNIGLVKYVPASQLSAFEAYIAAHPVRAFGPREAGPHEAFQVVPPGRRPYYCFAVAGLARSALTYLAPGIDFCTLSPQLVLDREAGLTGYAPVFEGTVPLLGVETPIYRNGAVPPKAARAREFVGWLGDILVPKVLIEAALQGHPGIAVDFRYEARFSHVSFSHGHAPRGGQHATIPLLVGHEALGDSREGWSVETFGPAASASMLHNENALLLLIGGTLLSVLVGALMYVLATGRARALALVEEKTRELSHRATHDALTDLPNRAMVIDLAKQMLARAAREPGLEVGALFIDFDGFKDINDNLGHAPGDQFLKAVAERLRATVRGHDVVGRLAGDEFVVLVDSPTDEQTLNEVADRVGRTVREPIEIGGRTVSVTASIGIALGAYATPDELLRDADLALYAAKAKGKNRHVLFQPHMAGADRAPGMQHRL